jgi:hypothetical protein
MNLPYQASLIPLKPGERQIPERPRRGEPGGPPCRICTGDAVPPVWSDESWTLHPPVGGSLPGTVWLASRAHVDSFSDLPERLQEDFGRVEARGMMLPLWEEVLPNVPDDELRASAGRVAAAM